ncbi:MAG TPA: phenylacetate-CoA oxygenase/reductase subunit PaaK [Phaeodactylibacter sp.]|nr:phenylacetate-CoA oxygenase/reductase subunit PaaK [Phaeodactylibacter sp.]
MSNTFHKIKIAAIEKTTSDAVVITLGMPEELKGRFVFKQGQYLTLQAEINGEEVRRSYSLCSSPLDGEWKVGIKKIEGGKFSTFANEVLQEGDVLEVMPPKGGFFVEIDKTKQKNYVAFAAGSGITPIFSIIKTHLLAEPNATFKLFYINQTVASIILKEEIEALKNLFMNRFEVFYFLTKEHRNVPLLKGRLDEEKLNIIFKSICDAETVDEYFSCGPEAMILMIRDFLLKKNVAKNKIHFELFNTTGASVEAKKKVAQTFKGKVAAITIMEGGKSMSFKIEQGSDNILDAAIKNAADLPFACKGGVCCTCRAKLIEGEVKMLVNYGLEEEEVEQGYILTCQSIPVSEKIVVDFDS